MVRFAGRLFQYLLAFFAAPAMYSSLKGLGLFIFVSHYVF